MSAELVEAPAVGPTIPGQTAVATRPERTAALILHLRALRTAAAKAQMRAQAANRTRASPLSAMAESQWRLLDPFPLDGVAAPASRRYVLASAGEEALACMVAALPV